MSPPSEGESVSRLRSMEQDRVGSQSGQRTQAEATDTGTEGQPGPQYKPESREAPPQDRRGGNPVLATREEAGMLEGAHDTGGRTTDAPAERTLTQGSL